MLAALESGVKGGKWYSLMDKVYTDANLRAAWKRVRANKGAAGVDAQSVAAFSHAEDKYLGEIREALQASTYRPAPIRRAWIPKPGRAERRPLGIPTVKDRIVQTALRNVLEPIYEARFAETSYGFRPGRSCKDALRRVDEQLKQGFTWVVDADIRSYFETIDRELLMEAVKEEVADGRIIDLIEGYLEQPVMDGLERWNPATGTPQGAVISPLLANIYLHVVDEAMSKAGHAVTRYADDLVVLCKSETEARAALALLEALMQRLKLTLHPDKTRIVDAVNDEHGFEFLGYRFAGRRRWIRSKSLGALKDRVRSLTKRTNGHSLRVIIDRLNPVLRGWYAYFKHAHKTVFIPIDAWIRMRLRSILRRRNKKPGRGRGTDHQRWPNAYFAAQGLFTLRRAYDADAQPR
jgi:RNA-directed DNA polymerase